MNNYCIYIGGNLKKVEQDEKKALEYYESLPSGEGKRPSLRRMLILEQILKEDKR